MLTAGIRVAGIRVSYGRRQVLHDVEWTVRSGVTGLLGPNGSGKTTLLSAMVGLVRPSAGTVETPAGTRLGFVPQRFSLAGGMRVVDAMAYTAWVNGVAAGTREAAARRALDAVDLAGAADRKVRTLSGGQRQRVGIAAGLAHEPELLVLDEPTVGLDAEQRWRLRDLIADLGRTRTVVVSTHLLDDVSHLCDRVGVLADGRLVFDGTVDDLETRGTEPDSRRSPIEQGYARLLARGGE